MIDYIWCCDFLDVVEFFLIEDIVQIDLYDVFFDFCIYFCVFFMLLREFVIVYFYIMEGDMQVGNFVYMVGIIEVKDFQIYVECYGMFVGEMFVEVGVEIVVVFIDVEVLEGDWNGNWLVIVKVLSVEIV